MPINPNEEIENSHTIALGQSGSGKTWWVVRHPAIKRRGARVLLWDPYESPHYAAFNRFDNAAAFAMAVKAAVKSGKGFRLCLSVSPSVEAFEAFCRLAWAAADGKKRLVVVMEELADVTGSGRAVGTFASMIRVGRKYGVQIIAATQRPQEIPKTLLSQLPRKWCGYIDPSDRTYCEQALGLERGALATIAARSYKFAYIKDGAVSWGGKGMKAVKP